MSLLLFDFECEGCGQVFEELADRDSPVPVKCLKCGHLKTRRLISAPRIDPSLGLDAQSFPTMGAAWEKKRAQRKRIEERHYREHGG